MAENHWYGLITARGGFPWATLEDGVAKRLREMGYRTWIPREKRPTRKRPDLTVPMVRGYVFVQGDIDWQAVKKVKGYVRAIRCRDERLAIITQAQIDRMRDVCSDMHASLAKPGLKINDKVRIRKGAFAEIEAVIKECTKGGHVVEYTMMGKTFTQRVSAGQLEAA